MTSHQEIAQRWIERVAGTTTRGLLGMRGSNVYPSPDGDTIYSYGSHFHLADVLRDGKGEVRLILLNGDRYSVSTTQHQNIVRAVVRASGIPHVVVPFTVLASAGIMRETVAVVDKTEDGMRWTLRSATEAPDEWRVSAGNVRNVSQAADGRFWYEHQVHVLGESVLSATVLPRRGKARKAHFLSGFDTQEAHLSYFFAELPRKVTTLAEAYVSLKPQAVLDAEAQGREVKRQGDVFAIPLPSATMRGLRKAGAVFGRQAHVLGTNHAATEVAVLGKVTLARRTLWHRPEGRNPDHRRVALGGTWHVLVKNTVPVSAGR